MSVEVCVAWETESGMEITGRTLTKECPWDQSHQQEGKGVGLGRRSGSGAGQSGWEVLSLWAVLNSGGLFRVKGQVFISPGPLVIRTGTAQGRV